MEEPTVCPVCVVFEPQAWRKSLCRNCFKTFEQHEGSLPTEESTQREGSPPRKAEDSKDSNQPSPDVTSATVPSVPAAPSPSSSSKPNTPSTLSAVSEKASVPKTTPSSSPSVTTVHPTTTTTTTATTTKVSSPTSPASSKASAPSTSPASSKASAPSPAKTKEGSASKLDDSKKGTAGVRANGGSASAGKPGADHKVTLISSIAGKIEQPKRTAGTSTPTAATSSSKQSSASDSKLKGVGDKKGPSSKSPSSKESVSSPTSLSSATPLSSPASSSSSLHDNSVRSKWEKRVASAGGGGGGGAELGARFDVKKGQKATDAKVKSAESGDVASKSRSGDIGKKVGKEASQPEDSTVSATATTPAGSSLATGSRVATGKITATEKIEQKQSAPSSKAVASTTSTGSTSNVEKSLTSKSKSSEHVPATATVTATVCTATTTVTATVSSDTSSLKSPSANKASTTVSSSSAAVAKQDVATKSQVTIKSPSTTKVDGKELQQQNKKQESPVKASEEKKEKTETVAKEQAEQKEDVHQRELRTKVEQLEKELMQKEETLLKKLADKEGRLLKELASKEKEVDTLRKRVVAMEAECGHLKNQADEARRSAVKGQREELEKTLGELRQQVSAMEEQCSRLESDNQTLLHKLRDQEQQVAEHRQQVGDDDDKSTREMSGLQGELRTSEMEVENLREENTELRHELSDLKREMEEMYDSFRENELDEFRELQRELDLTAKNCRVLQFKLRKAERRNDQVEHDRQHYEEKLRSLQQQFESGDARSHIEALEEELRTAKEVSVRLHDELDLIEERRNKALDENRHLTELLEQTDKKQFRMEMEIDKLRDQIADLRQQLRDRSPSRKEGTPDRKPDVLGRQGSQDYDSAQLMRDLCDSVERETDLKEQLKFIEEESRMLRKKLSEMEDENEALRVQLKKLSLKASRWKEESEGKGHSLAHNHGDSDQDSSRERLDSSDDESSVVTLKLQVAMMEQELMTSQRAQSEAEKDTEKLLTKITSLEQCVRDYEYEAAMRKEPAAPSPPDTYYEEKVRELTQVADELRWRIIEKDRELERLSATSALHSRHSGHHGHHGHHARDAGREVPREGRLKKSKSLDSDHAMETLLRQLDSTACDATSLRHQVTQARDERDKAEGARKELQERVRELEEQMERSASRPLLVTVPSVHADDAAVENIELKDKLRRAEDEVRALRDQVRTLTDNLRTLSRSTSPRLGSSGAASPQVSPHPPVFPLSGVSDSQVTATDSPSSAAAPIAVAAPAVATATPASTSFAASASTVGSAGILHVPDDARALHELLQEADEERRVLASTMAELEQENARLRASLGSEPLGVKGVAVAKTEDEGQKRQTDRQTRQTSCTSVDISQSHEALMDRELDMQQQLDDLLLVVKRQEEKEAALNRELMSLRAELQSVKDHARKTELELLQDLDMLHDKNSVLSNLLDIVQERANTAEEELEKLMQENSAPGTRSASAVSAVSALSDASCGSDEVFLSPPSGTVGEKGQIIHRDWEAKLKNRIESLERLLAEERQKVNMAEKKVRMACIETLAPSVSDDIKLRVREKELLQEELLENQRHLHIAADQIKGLRERLHAMEEEHHRLKVDYGRLASELDKRDDLDSDQTAEDSDKTPENSVEPEDALVALRAATLLEQESPSLLAASHKENKQMAELAGVKKQCDPEDGVLKTDEVRVLERELAIYTLKAEQLEYKVQEISDIWRSKSAATEREKKALEADLCDKTRQAAEMSQMISQLQQQIKLLETEVEKARSRAELYAQVQTRNEEMKKEVEEVKAQTVDHQTTMRQLRESVSTRDERLKEKDDIIRYLNTCLEERQKEIQQQDARLAETSSRLAEQASSLAELQQHFTLVPSAKEDGGETDLEKENTQLRETTRALRAELEQGEAARQDVEMARRSMAQMSLNWEKEKAALHISLNIADEKLRLYETLTTTSVNEAMECLKADSMKYFAEKENLKSQLAFLHQELTTSQRLAKETISRLQGELSSKLRLLKEEVDINSRLQPEIERLKIQEQRAYRLQQEERVLRAEHQAMKMRYETRLEKLSVEYSKMLGMMEELQKERQLDKDMVAGVQKAMTLIREAHAQDQTRWDEDKARMERQLAEMAETRLLVEKLRKMTSELKEQVCIQEHARVDLVNKFSTDRAAWQMERANLQSKINQLEEQLARGLKDGGTVIPLEAAWAKERANQQRLLAQAHDLALDLQRQLQSRDQEAAKSRRLLTEQLETERQAWDKERREKDKLLSELEARVKQHSTVQRQVLEMQERAEREAHQARCDRAQLRQQLSRDAKAVDDVMSGFVRLRELGGLLISQGTEEQATSADQKAGDSRTTRDLDQDMLKYVKEAFIQICAASDQLAMRGNQDKGVVGRKLTNSELELLQELTVICHEGDDVFPVQDVTTSMAKNRESSQPQHTPSPGDIAGDISLPAINSPLNTSAQRVQSSSHAFGSRSAQASRSATPEVGHQRSSDVSPSRQSPNITDLSPASLFSSSRKASSEPLNSLEEKERAVSTNRVFPMPEKSISTVGCVTTSSCKDGSQASAQACLPRATRPHTLTKSLSVDSPHLWSSTTAVTLHKKSLSASTTPTHPCPVIQLPTGAGEFSCAGVAKITHGRGGLSPRSARKRFFEEQPSEQMGYLSWPERGRVGGGHREGGYSTVDPSEVRRVAEEEHECLLSRMTDLSQRPSFMRTSTSWDEKIHHQVVATPTDTSSFIKSQLAATDLPLPQSSKVSANVGVPSRAGQETSAKDRRRRFNKSSSLDSTVGTCIARAGMQALGPPAAPAAFSPSDMLTSVKAKLTPVIRSKAGKESDPLQARPPSPLFIQTPVPDIPLRPSTLVTSATTSSNLPATATADTSSQRSPGSENPTLHEGRLNLQSNRSFSPTEIVRGRDSRRPDERLESRDTRWRSQSADRATRPLLVHSDVLVPAQVWQFSETAV